MGGASGVLVMMPPHWRRSMAAPNGWNGSGGGHSYGAAGYRQLEFDAVAGLFGSGTRDTRPSSSARTEAGASAMRIPSGHAQALSSSTRTRAAAWRTPQCLPNSRGHRHSG